MMATITLRVWVGCLACYNEGYLVGEWFDADDCPTEAEDFTNRVGNIPSNHVSFDHEELWCFDTDGFGGLLRGECSPMEAQRIAAVVEDIDDDMRYAYGAYVDHNGCDVDTASLESFRDAFHGHWDSERDYAQDWAEQTEAIKSVDWPYTHIDWESATDELFCDLTAIDDPHGGIWVFSH